MKINTHLHSLALMLGALAAVQPAHANMVTFEDVSKGSVASAAIDSGGFRFATVNGHAVTDLVGYGASNGSHQLVYLANSTGAESFSAISGGAFDLISIDLGGWLNFGSSVQNLTLTGVRSGGATVVATVSVAPTSFQTYALSGFTNLQSVTLGNVPGVAYVAVDNLQVSPVPEPHTFAMLLAGLGLVGAFARRRKTPSIGAKPAPDLLG